MMGEKEGRELVRYRWVSTDAFRAKSVTIGRHT